MLKQSGKEENIVILVTRSGMGRADQALQTRLIKSYLTLVEDARPLPAAGKACSLDWSVGVFYTNLPIVQLVGRGSASAR